MAIQMRRGAYADFDPTKMKPGEIAVVQSGDPLATDGKAIYACITAGDVKRMATQDELSAYDADAQAAAEVADEAKTAALAAQTTAEAAQTAAETAQTGAGNAQTAAETAQAAAEAAAENAQTALAAVNAKAAEINAIVLAQHTIETGGAATDENGGVYIYLSETFKEELGENGTYRIFLQEEGEGKVYVNEKTITYFLVSGTDSLDFSWMIII